MFCRYHVNEAIMVDLLDKLRDRVVGNATTRRAQRLLLCWWRMRPIRCTTCYDGRSEVVLGKCPGCGRIYFKRGSSDDENQRAAQACPFWEEAPGARSS